MDKWFGYPKKLWILALGLIINVTGNSFLWPLTTIYVSEVLGRSITTAGLVLMLQAAAGLVGSLLGGYLYDQIGGRKAILIGISVAILSVTIIAFTKLWILYLLMMMLLGLGNGIIPPAVYAMAGGVWPEGGRKAFNLMYVSQNIGVAIGTALGGILAQHSFTISFLGNGTTYFIFSIIVWFGLNEQLAREPRGSLRMSSLAQDTSQQEKRGLYALVVLCIGFMFCWVTYVQWQTSISSYMHDLGFSLSKYSLLWTINGVLIILIQPFSSLLVKRLLPNIRGQLIAGVFLFILTFTIVSQFHHQYTSFILGMSIMTLGEIFIWPAVPNAAAGLAPPGKKGIYQGMVNSFSTAGRMVGPLIGGALFDYLNVTIMFYFMIGVLFFALLCYSTYSRLIPKKNQEYESYSS